MQQSTPLPQDRGEPRQPEKASVIIFDKVRVPNESTSPEAGSQTLDKSESTNIKRGRRRRGKISQKDILGIQRSVDFRIQESGLAVSVLNLPNNSYAVVVRGAWVCVQCGERYPGINALGNVCEVCRGTSNA